MSIDNLERQHNEIRDLLIKIKKNMNKSGIEQNVDTLVKDMNVLSGKLSIHMSLEDKFLYPKLMNSDNNSLKDLSKKYNDDMGSISAAFKVYKTKFNIKSKILNNADEFLKESLDIIKVLEERISKEDKFLYPKIKSL